MASPAPGVLAFKDPNDPMAYQPVSPMPPVLKLPQIPSRQTGDNEGPLSPVASGIGKRMMP